MRATRGPKGFPVYDSMGEVSAVDHMDVLVRHEGLSSEPYQDFEGEWRIGAGSYVHPGLQMDEPTARSIAQSKIGLEPMMADEEQEYRLRSSAWAQMGNRFTKMRKELPRGQFGYHTVMATTHFELMNGRKDRGPVDKVISALKEGNREKAFEAVVASPAAERDPERAAEIASMIMFGG